MRRSLLLLAALALPLATPAAADLAKGTKAPDFTTTGYVAGKDFSIHLKQALANGPVVLYFFPAANTAGCNAEAHAFAEAIGDFQAEGATVVGLTAGRLEFLQSMSEQQCAGKFGIAKATPDIVKAYDVDLKKPDGTSTGITTRTSYVIAPNGKVLFALNDMNNPVEHIHQTLAVLKQWRAAHKHG